MIRIGVLFVSYCSFDLVVTTSLLGSFGSLGFGSLGSFGSFGSLGSFASLGSFGSLGFLFSATTPQKFLH